MVIGYNLHWECEDNCFYFTAQLIAIAECLLYGAQSYNANCCYLWQALKVLRTAEYAPFVVFVAAPTIASFTEV